MVIEVTNGTLVEDAQSGRFALAAALRNLALLPHEFQLVSDADDGLVIRLRVDPIRDPGPPKPPKPPKPELTRYRRTVGMLRNAALVSEYSSVSCVDLRRAVVIEVEFGNLRTQILRAEPLPEFASIGEQGRWFDHAMVPALSSAEPITADTVTWSLERWDGQRALWCNRVRSAAGGQPTEEGYVIRPDGTIDGAVIGGWMPDPAAEGGGRPFRLVSAIGGGSRPGQATLNAASPTTAPPAAPTPSPPAESGRR
jgi:hypothetical protein